jgi:hypothetical protein
VSLRPRPTVDGRRVPRVDKGSKCQFDGTETVADELRNEFGADLSF